MMFCNARNVVCAAALALSCVSALADSATVTVVAKGKRTTRTVEIVDGRLSLPSSSIGAADTVEVLPDFATAKTGDKGYFVAANGFLGTYSCPTNYEYLIPFGPMPICGMKTPGRTFVAFVDGMSWDFRPLVRVRDGVYTLALRFLLGGRPAEEDIKVEFKSLGADAEYPQMAAAYRERRLKAGEVKPIVERMKSQPELEYAAKAVEVRIRQAWKPAPPPIEEQTVSNEPPMKVVVTFDRVGEFVRACKAAGVGPAEFCLVGWNLKGHDGRYPQIFPVEPELGGEGKLRKLVKETQSLGYLMVCHNNHSDCYHVAECWDEEYVIKNPDGTLSKNACWSGGRMYNLCPRRAWELFASKDLEKISDLGFRGMHYIDVLSVTRPRACFDPRHPLTKREAARYLDMIQSEARRTMGGCGSEGGYDFAAGSLDYALYVSFANPNKKPHPLVDRIVPLWQLVYNGIIMSCPFATCANYTIKDRDTQLRLVEFGGRPMFYIHSSFVTGFAWMGKEDLELGTQEDLERSVAAVKRGSAEYAGLSSLQFVYMTDHRELAPGVTLTGYANDWQVVVNRTDRPFDHRGQSVPSRSWHRFCPER